MTARSGNDTTHPGNAGATRHRATFFVLGTKARRYPDVVREIH
jgi:hypothetical protein